MAACVAIAVLWLQLITGKNIRSREETWDSPSKESRARARARARARGFLSVPLAAYLCEKYVRGTDAREYTQQVVYNRFEFDERAILTVLTGRARARARMRWFV